MGNELRRPLSAVNQVIQNGRRRFSRSRSGGNVKSSNSTDKDNSAGGDHEFQPTTATSTAQVLLDFLASIIFCFLYQSRVFHVTDCSSEKTFSNQICIE